MKELYFVRHSKVDYIPDEKLRSLSLDGKLLLEKLVVLFSSIDISRAYSSPYKRAIETINPILMDKGLPVTIHDDLMERRIGVEYLEDFDEFAKTQWENHNYKKEQGESLNDVRLRALRIIETILSEVEEEKILIGTHGTFLASLIGHYNCDFGYGEWKSMRMPSVYKFTYEKGELKDIDEIEF